MTAYRLLAETLDAVAESRGKLAKIERLAAALSAVGAEELPAAARLLSGSPFAESDAATTSVGSATVVKAGVAVTGWDEDTLYACAAAIGDLGEAIGLLRPPLEASVTIAEAEAFFRTLSRTRKPADKRALLESLLARAGPVETKYLLKTLTGSMRVGADLATVEEAIAVAFGEPRETVARARRDSGDIGETAAAARARRLSDVAFRLFHPIGFMLASPIENAEDIEAELPAFAVEDKFDGIRAHAHKDGGRVALFSRTLDDVTAQFPDVAAALASGTGNYLLDGEIVAWGEDRPASFFQLQKRLGRKKPEDAVLAAVPAVFIAYDCLALDGEGLFEKPWSERRARLDEIHAANPGLRLSEVSRAETAGELEGLFARARERGNEGLVLKQTDSPYQAGKRGRAWRKWKRALATLDVVVTAVEQGHGKRAGMLSDYTFALRDGDRYVNVGKAYSGLTDEEIRRMGTVFRGITTARYGPVRAVEPRIVVEIAFDSIQESARHKSGFALRFPRIVRLRPDKGPADIATLDEVRDLHAQLTGRAPRSPESDLPASSSRTPP